VYESPGAAPRVEDIAPAPVGEFIESFTTRIYELAREQGGSVPYTAIREVTENFIHANFAEPVVSILEDGMTLRFADQGPGISDKARAVMPGFTTAHGEMKQFIRGVGSGLPIVRDYLSISGGSLLIEDNLGGGSVVTLYAHRSSRTAIGATGVSESVGSPSSRDDVGRGDGTFHGSLNTAATGRPHLSTRQKQVLALVMESGAAGPSLVAKELGCGVSTAYRDLASLEELGLICSDGGKRTLTEQGLGCFDHLVTR
jgi:DNA-binding CsgD family transcriptional regulator